jgi:hypothetical protein
MDHGASYVQGAGLKMARAAASVLTLPVGWINKGNLVEPHRLATTKRLEVFHPTMRAASVANQVL